MINLIQTEFSKLKRQKTIFIITGVLLLFWVGITFWHYHAPQKSFEDFYMKPNREKLYIQEKDKINILLTHCDLNGAEEGEVVYNPIQKSKLKEIGFDYVAMGHIHKPNYDDNVVYPGSLISLGFDELGKHRNDKPVV